jgi:hypothetical protein
MADFYLKKGDTLSAIEITCKDANGVAVNLTGATVKFSMKLTSTGAVKVSLASATIVSATGGIVSYSWAAADVDTAGEYSGEFQVTFSAGGIQTFPNSSDIPISIRADVA